MLSKKEQKPTIVLLTEKRVRFDWKAYKKFVKKAFCHLKSKGKENRDIRFLKLTVFCSQIIMSN